MFLFLVCAYAKTPDLAENIGGETIWYGIHDEKLCLFCAYKNPMTICKLLKRFGVPDGI